MTDQSYYVQKAVHTILTQSSGVTALVPTASIADLGGTPTLFPSIIMGEAQIINEGQRIDRSVVRVYLTLHLWTKEPHLNEVKKVGGAVLAAMSGQRPALGGGFHLADMLVESARYIRDPSGENAHGIVTVNTLVGAA